MRKVKNHTWVECPYCKHHYWLNDIWLDETQERIEHHKKMFCKNTTGHIKILQDERFNSISIEKRQEILDLMRTGITVGEVSKLLEINSDVTAEVICRNIRTASFLRSESV